LKYTSLALILAVAVWLLWPPSDVDAFGSKVQASAREKRIAAKYVIRVSPGMPYMPGVSPMGIGEPLHGLADAIAEFEKLFPDTRIELMAVPLTREYLVTQLSSGRAPDIINVNVEDVWVDAQKNWYVPLDRFLETPNPFVPPGQPGSRQWWDQFKYQAITRGKVAPDGNNYCISYDMVETGLFYNKDIFREVGVEVPKDWDEFLVILEKIKNHTRSDGSHFIPVLMNGNGNFSDWCVDLFFDQFYHGLMPGLDLTQDPAAGPYLQDYLDWDELCFLHGKGFFTARDPRYRQMWELMRQFRQYANRDLNSTDLMREFVTGKGAIFWAISQFTYALRGDKSIDFDWGVFYLPPFTKKTTPYASETPMCVIGGSCVQFEVTASALADTPETLPMAERIAQSERLGRVVQFLQYLCMPENCNRIVNEYESFLPNIVGVPVAPSLQPFDELLQRRYATTKWVYTFDLKFQEIQNRMLDLYLNDGITLDEFIGWMERNQDAACENAAMRKQSDFAPLEKRWAELAPARAGMEDLPRDR
jgi:raffinose/stachyose/melibiose transport system substrate-binding protein